MSRRLFFALCALGVASWTGCAWLPGAKTRKVAEAEQALVAAHRAPSPVGRVSLVNTEERFALIEAAHAQLPTTGTVLRTYAEGAVSAEMRVSAVRRRPFLVADLLSGTPKPGDLVVKPGMHEETPRAEPTVAVPAPPKPGWRRWLGFLRGGD